MEKGEEGDGKGDQEPTSIDNMSAEEALRKLEAAGISDSVLILIRRGMEQGLHPLQALQILHQRENRTNEESRSERVLETFDVEGIARYIAEKECKRIIVMCGAGMSTSAGIPDFRSPGTGLYDNLQRFNLPDPQAIFSVDYFQENPSAFYELAREMWPDKFSPTPAHYFVRLLSEKGILHRCYTQNIDSLERMAGIPEELVIAAHGNFDKAHVVGSDPEIEVDINELKVAIDKGEEAWRALSKEKGGLVKPKIVFFGESLPDRFCDLYLEDLKECDLLIVFGTSLTVAPFNRLVSICKEVPRLLVNNVAAGTCDQLHNGFRYEKSVEDGENWRDVWHQSDCDSGSEAIAAALGWKDDLQALIESGGKAEIARAPWGTERVAPPSV